MNMDYNGYDRREERQISRSEKIRLAKSSFTPGAGRERSFVNSQEDSCLEEGGHRFGILRMVTAGVLFFVLVLSFHLNLSYKEYDKEYVKQVLSDDSHWESLVNQVTQVMKQNISKKK